MVGADADIAIWNPEREVKVSADMLHDNVGYTPYEGRTVRGWPETVLIRGRTVIDDGNLEVEPGSGEFLPCAPPERARPLGRTAPEMDPARNWHADLRV